MFLYCLRYCAATDCVDVALCRAWSKKQALKKFGKMYIHLTDDDVFRVKFNYCGFALLVEF